MFRKCNFMGVSGLSIRYLGGLNVPVSFSSREQAIDFMENHKEKWKVFFKAFEHWSDRFVQSDRLAWIGVREKKHINKIIKLKWNSRSYSVWVEEDPSPMNPTFLETSFCSSDPISGLPSERKVRSLVSPAVSIPSTVMEDHGSTQNISSNSPPQHILPKMRPFNFSPD